MPNPFADQAKGAMSALRDRSSSLVPLHFGLQAIATVSPSVCKRPRQRNTNLAEAAISWLPKPARALYADRQRAMAWMTLM